MEERRRRGERLWQTVGALVLLGFLASAFTPLPNRLAARLRTASRIEPADAIVVLGAGMREDGTLGDGSIRRALLGILLYRKGLAPLLAFAGPAQYGPVSEAEIRADLARGLGVPEEGILVEAWAWTTREEAARLRGRLAPRQARRILLVTDSQHMTRAQALFTRVGFEVLPATTEETSGVAQGPEGRLRLMRALLGEVVARLYYRAAGYL
jgi:uncharacterized SAM-binding protein YcdF (DUF218 family)